MFWTINLIKLKIFISSDHAGFSLKNYILEKIWLYSSKTETHTIETHIYRLRQKIKETFNDEDFIKSTKDGYSF